MDHSTFEELIIGGQGILHARLSAEQSPGG